MVQLEGCIYMPPAKIPKYRGAFIFAIITQYRVQYKKGVKLADSLQKYCIAPVHP